MIDGRVGRILDTRQRSGKSENTHVFIMSGHGDYMGDHGTVLKHGVLSVGLIRVPLIWAAPDAAQAASPLVLITDAGLAFADKSGHTPSRTLVHDSWRLTLREGSQLRELFDHETDPHELSNLWADSATSQRKTTLLHMLAECQLAQQAAQLIPTQQA